MGVFDSDLDAADDFVPDDDIHSDDRAPARREIVTTPMDNELADAPLMGGGDNDNETVAIARLSAFSFGAKAAPGAAPRMPLLPALPIREHHHHHSAQISISSPTFPSSPGSRPPSLLLTKAPAFPTLDLAAFPPRDSLSAPRSRPTSPTRKRHSHNRSESISLPNLKLGRPQSLGLPSPSFPSAPNSPFGDVTPRSSSRLSTPISTRLKFEPSDKEKEESRRRALDKLTGGGAGGSSGGAGPRHEEPRHHEITLPAFDDDDDLSATSSRPPSSTTMHSTASSSRPTSLIVSGSTSFNGSTSPLPWSTFEETDRWSFNSASFSSARFDAAPKEEALPPSIGGVGFDLNAANKTSSVLISSGLGVLAEEDETESDDVADGETDTNDSAMADAPSPTDDTTSAAGPTPSRLRELHLVSSVSSAGASRRGSNPEVLQAFSRATAQSRETPTKGYNSATARGRPRPLGLDEATSFLANSSPSPVKGARPVSFHGSFGIPRRAGSRSSSISYKKTDNSSNSGSSRDFGSKGPASPISSPTYNTSPLAEFQSLPRAAPPRACPRPRSMVLGMGGTSGRILAEVDETEEETESHGRVSTEASRDSMDGPMWTTNLRDSRDRIDAEMERDALREDVELWRKRCRGLEDKLEAERREASLLRERVRKLGDRLLNVSSSHAPAPSEERAIAQAHLIGEMREQLFSMASALERVRREKDDALARATELQATVDAVRTPQVSPHSLPTTPKSRPRPASLAAAVAMTPPEAKYADAEAKYADADFADADDEGPAAPQELLRHPNDEDPNLHRILGWGFPNGPVDKGSRESKRESFFGLSRPRPVHAPKHSDAGLGLAWANSARTPVDGEFDLPPIVVDASNRDVIIPVSPSRAPQRATGRVVSEPTRAAEQAADNSTPERQAATAGAAASAGAGFGLSFLSGYLSIPRSTPPVPRIAITPSSVSPKKTLLHLERDVFNARIQPVIPGSQLDFRHCCKRCTGEIIEL